MFAGLPVIATEVGGIPELIINHKGGKLVPPKNPIALANAIVQLAKNPRSRNKQGYYNRKRAYSLFMGNQMINNLEQLYVNLLRKKYEDSTTIKS